MHIVHLTAEFAPLAKVGGLGEVVFGLSQELVKKGHKVEIFLPKYENIEEELLQDQKIETRELKSFEKGTDANNTIWSLEIGGCKVFLIKPHPPNDYFTRKRVYGEKDDISRFLYFSRACLDFLGSKKKTIDILHIHDWHTSIAAPLYNDLFSISSKKNSTKTSKKVSKKSSNFKTKAIILTIHNFQYQGKCAVKDLNQIGMEGKKYLTPEKMQDDISEYKQSINLLKGGIIYSDAITTVSPSYSKEILTPKKGYFLDPTMRKNKKKLTGILNGINNKVWNPATDTHLHTHYTAKDPIEKILQAKKENKQSLAEKVSLKKADVPLVACISRLVPQKGPDLIKGAIEHVLEKGGQFILLGSSATGKIQEDFNEFKEKLIENRNAYLHLEYNHMLDYLTYASADFLIVPSLFEPCGLIQMIALRYGTIPIVRETGGLKDTIYDVDSNYPESQKNGFTFSSFDISSLNTAIDRAFHYWHNNKEDLKTLIKRSMKMDFSWEKSCKKYLKIYEKIAQS